MPMAAFRFFLGLGLIVLAGSSAAAQPMSTPADRIVRPGDKIEWTAASPHFLRLGGPGQTPRADIEKVLTFMPALANAPNDTLEGEPDATITGTIKDDATTSGVGSFVFVCGQHPVAMQSSSFTIEARSNQPIQTLKIRAAPGNKWIMQKADGTEVQVDTTP